MYSASKVPRQFLKVRCSIIWEKIQYKKKVSNASCPHGDSISSNGCHTFLKVITLFFLVCSFSFVVYPKYISVHCCPRPFFPILFFLFLPYNLSFLVPFSHWYVVSLSFSLPCSLSVLPWFFFCKFLYSVYFVVIQKHCPRFWTIHKMYLTISKIRPFMK